MERGQMHFCVSSKCLVTTRTEIDNFKMTFPENGGIVFLQNFVTRPLDHVVLLNGRCPGARPVHNHVSKPVFHIYGSAEFC